MSGRPMSKLLVHSHDPDADGCVVRVTPDSAGWRYVGCEVYRLAAGARLALSAPERETCVVVLSGRADLAAGGHEWRDAGGRETVFDGPPAALYVPPGCDWAATAASGAELAVCTAPAEAGAELRLLGPDDIRRETRG